MTNVIQLKLPASRQPLTRRLAGLIQCFAQERRFGDDVFWLKENAELLNILECTGQSLDGAALAPMEGFYAQVYDRMSFFPQYYRFLLSIALDLEDLGLPGDKGESLVDWAARNALVEAELNDLQRAEARRLMLRRGIDPVAHDTGLDDRLRRYIGHSDSFALPNKKAAYELTHIVFYLGEYGRRDPGLDADALRSLAFAGTLAYLDQNADLLAEICVALRFAGQTAPQSWEEWVMREAGHFTVTEGDHAEVNDNYHDYFVCNWLAALRGGAIFADAPTGGRAQFDGPFTQGGPLRDISQRLFGMGPMRSGDWHRMRDPVLDVLDETGRRILTDAEACISEFGEFFSKFARANQIRPSVAPGLQLSRGQG